LPFGSSASWGCWRGSRIFILAALALWFAGAPVAGLLLGVLGATTPALNALTEDRAAF
jgi:hypothetical protein